jgi:hypothetical protein
MSKFYKLHESWRTRHARTQKRSDPKSTQYIVRAVTPTVLFEYAEETGLEWMNIDNLRYKIVANVNQSTLDDLSKWEGVAPEKQIYKYLQHFIKEGWLIESNHRDVEASKRFEVDCPNCGRAIILTKGE